MTQIIVIARQNDFVIIGDTRNQGDHPEKPGEKIYHDQEQKVFCSPKHRIAIGIAGQASLPHRADPQDQLRVSYVMSEFMKYVESEAPGRILAIDIFSEFDIFVNRTFPDYANNILMIDLYSGGFDHHGHTLIQSRSNNGQYKNFTFSNNAAEHSVCAFSSMTAQGKDLVHYCAERILTDPGLVDSIKGSPFENRSPNLIRDINKYLSYIGYRMILATLVPLFRDFAVKDSNTETIVGVDFDCYCINNPSNPAQFTRSNYFIDPALPFGANLRDRNPNNYLSNKYINVITVDDLEQSRLQGVTEYFDQTGAVLVLTANNQAVYKGP